MRDLKPVRGKTWKFGDNISTTDITPFELYWGKHRTMREIARVLKPDGCLILTAPHIWGIHEEPHDYYRYTPFGLRYLAERAGLHVVEVRALAGFWVTAGARFCSYLEHFERGPLALAVRLGYLGIQAGALAMDRLHRVEGDAWNFLMVARKP